MTIINLPKTLETQVKWKYTLPGLSLTAGVLNKFTLGLIDNPDGAKNKDIEYKYSTLTIREICDIDRIVGRLDRKSVV